ncbi:MAG TPA: nuclear transport factor 2 family protein [Gemmatimonadaceae bacterium]
MKQTAPAANPDAYVAALTGWRRACVEELRAAVRSVRGLTETIKWGHLVYLAKGPFLLAAIATLACSRNKMTAHQLELNDFATRYAAAWSSRNPANVAAFYSERGSLTVNDGMPSVGRAAIAATARTYMTAFPDMVVRLERVEDENGLLVFHWIWTGTNSGPGGTDRFVRIRGYEEWTMADDGHIDISKGHYDEAEYQRQLRGGAPRS